MTEYTKEQAYWVEAYTSTVTALDHLSLLKDKYGDSVLTEVGDIGKVQDSPLAIVVKGQAVNLDGVYLGSEIINDAQDALFFRKEQIESKLSSLGVKF